MDEPQASARDRTGTAWVQAGMTASPDVADRMQAIWNIPSTIAVIADLGHNLDAEQVIRSAGAAFAAGCSGLHLHVRDEHGNDSMDVGLWRYVTSSIREICPDIVIDSGLRSSTADEREVHLRERHFELVALAVHREPDYVKGLLAETYAHDLVPQIAIWDTTDVLLAGSLYLTPGIIRRPANWLLVPGSLFRGIPMSKPTLMVRGLCYLHDLITEIDPGAIITVSASGRPSSYLTALATVMGLHIRPGLGETHWRHPHRPELLTSAEVVLAEAIQVARSLGREVATPVEYRELLGLAAVGGTKATPEAAPEQQQHVR